MAKTYNTYAWQTVLRELSGENIREASALALSSMNTLQAERVRDSMARFENKISGIGELSSVEILIALHTKMEELGL